MTVDFSSDKVQLFPGINDAPSPPTAIKAGNGAHFINVYNKLIDDVTNAFNDNLNTIQNLSNTDNQLEAQIQNLPTLETISTQIQQIVEQQLLIAQSTAKAPVEKWITANNPGAVWQLNPGERTVVVYSSPPIQLTLAQNVDDGSTVYLMNYDLNTPPRINTKIYLHTSFKGLNIPNQYLTFSAVGTVVGLIYLQYLGGWFPMEDGIFTVNSDSSNPAAPSATANVPQFAPVGP